MYIQTKNTILGYLCDKIGLNRKFHRYNISSTIGQDKNIIYSPAHAKIHFMGQINSDGKLIGKYNKIVDLNLLFDNQINFKVGYSYLNLYLSPKNKHFWITPYAGQYIFTKKNNGKAKLPMLLGLENFFKIEVISHAIKRNASISSILDTGKFYLGIVAIGSLNVNRINTVYEENKLYKSGDLAGYFSLGSTILLIYPTMFQSLISVGDKVNIGQSLLKLNKFN